MPLVYTSSSDVQARVPGRTISATTKPTTTQVEQWLLEGEARLLGALYTGGITAPAASTTGAEIMRGWATDYAESLLRMAWASTAGDAPKDGEAQRERFDKLIDSIFEKPAQYQAMLNSGSSSSDTIYMRGANTDTSDDDYIEEEFERDEVY